MPPRAVPLEHFAAGAVWTTMGAAGLLAIAPDLARGAWLAPGSVERGHGGAGGGEGPEAAIGASSTVGVVARHHPETAPVLASFGLDLCCGGELTLAAAAVAHALDLEDLLARLRRAAREPVGRSGDGGPAPVR